MAIAVIPALVTGYFGYKTALAQANTNTKAKTDTTYDTLKEAVEGLDTNVKQDQESLATLRNRILELEQRIASLHGLTASQVEPLKLKEAHVIRALPPNLEKAFLQRTDLHR